MASELLSTGKRPSSGICGRWTLGYNRAAYRLAYAYDATFSSDNAAENILLAMRQGDRQIADELKAFSSFTRTALKRSLSRRGLYDGPLDDEIDQPLKSALRDYAMTYGG